MLKSFHLKEYIYNFFFYIVLYLYYLLSQAETNELKFVKCLYGRGWWFQNWAYRGDRVFAKIN